MMTQIYSIQSVEEALMCVDAGADRIGVAAATGKHLPAELSFDKVKEIFDAVGDRAGKVLIVVTDTEDELYEPIRAIRPDVIHICGNEYFATPGFVRKAREICPGIKVLQAVAVDGEGAVDRAKYYAGFCDEIILDSVDPNIGGIGAAGVTNDWNIDERIVKEVSCPVILAGGLGPDNVAEAIAKVKPWGVDSFTRTSEKLGGGKTRKDPQKVREFIINANEAFRKLES
ncbi:MAG: phosphoribosylanthranilate isomerase [Oscillospiraceae bacterium]